MHGVPTLRRHRPNSPMRTVAAFAGGAVAAIIASRLLPPVVAQASGAALAAAGRDPFDALVEDHRAILTLLDHMAQSPDGAVFARTQRLFRLKRRLAAHAMAEEDVLYPLLYERAQSASEAKHLYEEHAEMKMHLYQLEQIPKDDPRWRDRVLELRTLIEGHVRQEEEMEFPKLQSVLDEPGIRRLWAHIQREKALLL